MHFVMATKDADWMTAFESREDLAAHRPPNKLPAILVMALEGEPGAPRTWNVNGEGVKVERGVIVGFHNLEDANHFLITERGATPRACRVQVAAHDIVAFADIDTAMWMVMTGVAVHMTEEQVQAEMHRRESGAGPSPLAPEADAAGSAPAEAPKTRAKKGKAS